MPLLSIKTVVRALSISLLSVFCNAELAHVTSLPVDTPSWAAKLGHGEYQAIAAIELKRYQQQHPQSQTLNSAQQRLLQKYIDYKLLADSGLWCQQTLQSDKHAQLSYKLWLHGDFANKPTLTPTCHTKSEEAQAEQDILDNSDLQLAIRSFQKRHKLDVDGVVGPATLRALNQTPDAIAIRIHNNLQRSLALSAKLAGQRYIIVNIPAFELTVFDQGEPALRMRTIVGRRSRPTPEMDLQLTTVVMNPSWNIPKKLTYRDIIPKVIKNSDYLTEQNMQVLDGWGNNEKEINPNNLDWEQIRQEGFPYRIRQQPGLNNALGQFKFITPNARAIYLHDTASKGLFARNMRAYSSGCVRVQNPKALARFLLKDSHYASTTQLDKQLNTGLTKAIALKKAIPVHFVYQTSWVTENGSLQLRNDVYAKEQHTLQNMQIASAQ